MSVAVLGGTSLAAAATPQRSADAALDRALNRLVTMDGGPPGVIAVVQRGSQLKVHAFGFADVKTRREPRADDHMRIASVAKAFSGATALALVANGVLSLDDTIGQRLPELPAAWHPVTLRQLLNHTSGLPDFTGSPSFGKAVKASLGKAPPPRDLLEFVRNKGLEFAPGSRYRYSNSDNVVVGLMAQAATGRSYPEALAAQVLKPLGLGETSLPRGPGLPRPFIHGYDLAPPAPPEDISTIFASGWAWASGGIVSTPVDLNRFIRGYVGGKLFGPAVSAQQLTLVPGGHSEPQGPGANAAGLAVFQYRTRCGTVYGHTGNTFGFTQFAAASRDGRRSATVSINLQRTGDSRGQAGAVFRALRSAEELAVCAALAGR
jgi:D-alanyl-D-alanine carboxypeptidase